MKIRVATAKDLDLLYSFYNKIIDHQKHEEYGAGWTRDVYPSRKDLQAKIDSDLFYLVTEHEQIIAAACLSMHEDDNYLEKPWTYICMDHRIAVLHLFGVDPEYRQKGIAISFLRSIIEENREKIDAIHLDVVDGNLPAEKLYEKSGFHSIGLYEVYYPDTGQIRVNLMEYNYEKR